MDTAILMRHAHRPYGEQDLSASGIAGTQNVARQMISAGIQPGLIVHSRMPRAKQTAELIVAEYAKTGKEVAVREDGNLDPDKKRILTVLQNWENVPTILIISHEFDILAAVTELTGTNITTIDTANAILIENQHNPKKWDCKIITTFQPRQ